MRGSLTDLINVPQIPDHINEYFVITHYILCLTGIDLLGVASRRREALPHRGVKPRLTSHFNYAQKGCI